MTCPDWTLLLARRDEGGADPDGWAEAVDHMDRCAPCRRTALAADPTLVFRRLPRVETTAADVESMRNAVASLRRASRVGALGSARDEEPDRSVPNPLADEEPTARAAGRRRPAASLRRIAAALLLAAAGLAGWFTGVDDVVLGAAVEAVPSLATVLPGATGAPGDDLATLDAGPDFALPSDGRAHEAPSPDSPTADELASRPVFEGLSRPRTADVYQVGDEDLLVVMVVDETLDI